MPDCDYEDCDEEDDGEAIAESLMESRAEDAREIDPDEEDRRDWMLG